MFNPAWLCENQVLLSVLMVVISVVGFVAGMVLLVIGASTATDKVENKLQSKLGWSRVRELKEKAADRFGLLATACVVVFVVGFGIFEPKALAHILLTVALMGGTMFLLSYGTDKVKVKLSYQARERWSTAFGIFFVCLMLAGVGLIVHGLYGWWILRICGGL